MYTGPEREINGRFACRPTLQLVKAFWGRGTSVLATGNDMTTILALKTKRCRWGWNGRRFRGFALAAVSRSNLSD
jgi:hypothetical protein